MPKLKRVLFLTLLSLTMFTPLQAAHAQTVQDLSAQNFNYFIHGQTTIEGSMFHTVFCSILGASPFNPCAGYEYASNGSTKPIVMNRLSNGGALGTLASVMGSMYDTPPVSATYYLAQEGQNLGIIPQTAYAQQSTAVQGSGAGVLAPVYTLWQFSRNIAYIFFVIVFVVVGFMIMLRQRINPQTVVTAQEALPGLAIGLVLITFSYFFSALIVDMAFLTTNIVVQIFHSAPGNSISGLDNATTFLNNNNVLNLFASQALNMNNFTQIFQGVNGQTGNVASVLPAIIGGIAGFFMSGLNPLGAIAGAAGGAALIPGLLIIVLMIALFIQAIRLLLGLLGAYIQILVMTIAAPFFIMIGSIPGRGGLIGVWWKNLLANVLIFPAVLVAILFAGAVMGTAGGYTTAMPLFGRLDSNFLATLIAYGILLGTPSIPEVVRQAFGIRGPQGFMGAVVGGFTGGLAAGRAVAGVGWNNTVGPYQQAHQAFLDEQAKYRVGAAAPPRINANLPQWQQNWIRRGRPF